LIDKVINPQLKI